MHVFLSLKSQCQSGRIISFVQIRINVPVALIVIVITRVRSILVICMCISLIRLNFNLNTSFLLWKYAPLYLLLTAILITEVWNIYGQYAYVLSFINASYALRAILTTERSLLAICMCFSLTAASVALKAILIVAV